jgi:hypothetical protein
MAIISPIDYGSQVPYCGDCSHFHVSDSCPDRDRDCGSFLCCNGMGDDTDSDGPTVINIYGVNYGAINM